MLTLFAWSASKSFLQYGARVGSLIALLSIIGGAVLGMKYLEQGSFLGAIGSLFARG